MRIPVQDQLAAASDRIGQCVPQTGRPLQGYLLRNPAVVLAEGITVPGDHRNRERGAAREQVVRQLSHGGWTNQRADVFEADQRALLSRVLDAEDVVEDVAEDEIPITRPDVRQREVGEVPQVATPNDVRHLLAGLRIADRDQRLSLGRIGDRRDADSGSALIAPVDESKA